MKGKEIAENLRGSKLPWIRARLCNTIGTKHQRGYCVLGLKARERGVSAAFLSFIDDHSLPVYILNDLSHEDKQALRSVCNYNDTAVSKDGCINVFDNAALRELEFPIENFVAYLKKLERRWKKEGKRSTFQLS